MGKASRWFRGLLGLKNTIDSDQNHPHKKKWSFTKSHKDKNRHGSSYRVITEEENEDDARNHARAVAAASAAVAEAAVAAAQAAAAVVQLTSSGRHIYLAASGRNLSSVAVMRAAPNEVRAAVVIQSHFRAYLSRRALRALKALVKLQALVRGHLIRKETAYTLRRLQALVRAQARARAGRVLATGPLRSSMKFSHFNHSGPATPEKHEHVMKQDLLMVLKRDGLTKSSRNVNYDHGSMDRRRGKTWWEERCSTGTTHPIDAHVSLKRRSLFHSSHLSLGHLSFSTSKDSTAHQLSSEVQSFIPPVFDDDVTFFHSASSRGGEGVGSFTPAKSDWSRSCGSINSNHPSYMSCTESSRAKMRSHSAPKHRPQMERSSSAKRCLFRAYGSQRGSGSLTNIY